MADGLELVDEVGEREQVGHRAEREAAKVLVEPCGDDAGPAFGEGERRIDDRGLEELGLVDADDVEPLRPGDELGDRRHRYAAHPDARVADDVGGVVPVVDPRLEDDDALTGDLGAAEATDHLLALATEHRPADDLDPAALPWWDPDHEAGS